MRCRGWVPLAPLLLVCAAAGCGDDDGTPSACGEISASYRFADGSPTGHADPKGARAAGQARAGRIADASLIRSPADVRGPIRVGDFLLVNDKIAAYIEDARPSDGYNPFGGEIAAIEPVGADGLPAGISQWGEGFFAAGGMVLQPEKVSVLADGADGGPAIVRTQGLLQIAPFLEGYAFLFGDVHPMPAAVDYVLAPGAEKLTVRLSIQNFDAQPVDLTSAQIVAFLQNRSTSFTPEHGFAPTESNSAWIGWESGAHAVAGRVAKGLAFNFLVSVEGAQLYFSSGAKMDACQQISFDYVELVTAAPGIDALREAMRRVDGEPAWRAVSGIVRDGAGTRMAGAYVHATRMDGTYLTRALTGADGSYALHVPAEAVQLTPTASGLPTPAAATLAAAASTLDLSMGALGQITVSATEGGSGVALPVRVQVIPAAPIMKPPPSFGVEDAGQDRAHLVFSADGAASVTVGEGTYRVVVSRGYEYELFDQMVSVTAGQTVALAPVLVRSVDTAGTQSADFHIHSFYSLDSADPVVYKVRGALAEGLELPVSSEHEYVVDFQPIVEQLGATAWARGFASEEISTSTFGHFGVVPMVPKPEQANRGAVQWQGKKPPAFFAAARQLETDPALIVNHPMSTTAFKGYFADVGFDNATATGDPGDWSDDFDAVEICNESSFDENRTSSVVAWFSLLRHGKKVFITGSSDNHQMTSAPVGYPRNYLRLGSDTPAQVTPAQVRDAIKRGTSVVAGGLYMTVAGPGGAAPGGSVSGAGPHAFDVVVQAPSWVSARTLEVIVDGETKQMLDLVPSVVPGPGQRFEATVDVAVPAGAGPHFVVFHAAGEGDLAPVHPGKKPFAVSNPIFLE